MQNIFNIFCAFSIIKDLPKFDRSKPQIVLFGFRFILLEKSINQAGFSINPKRKSVS